MAKRQRDKKGRFIDDTILESLKKRFATLETLEGSTYLITGIVLIASIILGLIDLIAAVAPIVGILLVAVGAYKIFIKRE